MDIPPERSTKRIFDNRAECDGDVPKSRRQFYIRHENRRRERRTGRNRPQSAHNRRHNGRLHRHNLRHQTRHRIPHPHNLRTPLRRLRHKIRTTDRRKPLGGSVEIET